MKNEYIYKRVTIYLYIMLGQTDKRIYVGNDVVDRKNMS